MLWKKVVGLLVTKSNYTYLLKHSLYRAQYIFCLTFVNFQIYAYMTNDILDLTEIYSDNRFFVLKYVCIYVDLRYTLTENNLFRQLMCPSKISIHMTNDILEIKKTTQTINVSLANIYINDERYPWTETIYSENKCIVAGNTPFYRKSLNRLTHPLEAKFCWIHKNCKLLKFEFLPWGLFYLHALTVIPAWVSNHIQCKMWDEITYPLPCVNGTTVENG